MPGEKIVCVLGMHRSGTSLLTRLLNLLGVELGAEKLITTEPVSANPTGYWENSQITAINDAILHHYKGNWHEPPQFKEDWQNDLSLDEIRHRASGLIAEQFLGASLWGWKDPRTCLTLPFWQELLGDELSYVICMRHPSSVAHSLARRDKFSADKSYRLWLKYVSSALKHTHGKNRLAVFYDDLIEQNEKSLVTLATFLDVSPSAGVLATAREFTEPALQHHPIELNLTVAHSELQACAVCLYSQLRESRWPDNDQLTQIEKLLSRSKLGAVARLLRRAPDQTATG